MMLPEHNGHQERVFSACTWYDTKLASRQYTTTFETKVLLKKNRAWMDAAKVKLDEDDKKRAAGAFRAMIKQRVQRATGEVDDEDTELFDEVLGSE